MTDDSQQQPTYHSNANKTNSPSRGGLLSVYARRQPPSIPQQPAQPRVPISEGLFPATPAGRFPRPVHQPDQFPASNVRHSTFVANTKQTVRRWSGKVVAISDKMAAIAGHTYQPPAPFMELYHPQQPAKNTTSLRPPYARPWRRSRPLRVSMLMHQRRARWRRSHPGIGRVLLTLLAIIAFLVSIASFSSTAYGYNYYQNQLPRLQELAHQSISQTTRIYDRNGMLIYDVYDTGLGPNSGRRTPITYNQIPLIMQDAMIAAEDHSFWTNSGVDPQGILRSGLAFFQHNEVQGGGSTITQQVIKNMTHDTDVSLNRKIPEAALAIGLTQQYPKWKILEMYFNVSSFGSNDLGIESAVEEYFHLMPKCDQHFRCVPGIAQLDWNAATGKHDPVLALARASLLAGMPQRPVSNNPTVDSRHKHKALMRQADILKEMIALGIRSNGQPITPELAKQAEQMMARWNFTPYTHIKHAPHFVDWIVGQVETTLGGGDPDKGYLPFITGGFNIRTTIDLNLEKYVEAAVTRHLTQSEYQRYTGGYGPLNIVNNVNDASVVVMNAHTGEILAMDGSADYASTDPKVGGEFNVAAPPNAGSGRAPGSSFKPIIYATAFQMGWYPGMVLPDFKTYLPNGSPAGTPIYSDALYTPPDYSPSGDPNYHHNDPSTIREALSNSYNVPAMKAIEYAGPDNVLVTARRLGITTLTNNGIAWGLGSQNIPLLQMTDAYQTFADAGQHIPSKGILDIWDNYGHNLYHYDPTHPTAVQVLSPQVSYMVTSVLMDEPSRALEFPGDHDLSFADRDPSCAYNRECPHQVAAKTGTTDNYADNLTIGYTPDVVVGVWAGNADNSPMVHVTGITGAAPIWHSVMEFAANGWCNVSTDQIPCPPLNRKSLHFNQPDTFPIPTGIQKTMVSRLDGLEGSGTYDWVPDNQIPLQSGLVQTSTSDNSKSTNPPAPSGSHPTP